MLVRFTSSLSILFLCVAIGGLGCGKDEAKKADGGDKAAKDGAKADKDGKKAAKAGAKKSTEGDKAAKDGAKADKDGKKAAKAGAKKKGSDPRTAEAIDNLDKLYKGAAVYYSTPRINEKGEKLPCQFPSNQGVTPGAGTCCSSDGLGGPDVDGDGRCDSDPSRWDGKVWSALNFQINDQHYYVYEIESSGTLKDAKMTISAYGDLDCDGTMSTFARILFADPNNSFAECSVKSPSAFYRDKPDE